MKSCPGEVFAALPAGGEGEEKKERRKKEKKERERRTTVLCLLHIVYPWTWKHKRRSTRALALFLPVARELGLARGKEEKPQR